MSRSIHETRRQYEEARRWQYGGRQRRDEALVPIWDRVKQKRRYKRRVSAARESVASAGIPIPSEIVTEPSPPHAHHPLSEKDIRQLLALLPGDVRPVIQRVHRRFGRLEEDMRPDGAEPDPLTGRHGFDRPGGIWVPALHGRFRRRESEIDLFAFVYDESELRVPEIQRIVMWLEQAHTFAHEVAHAWDRWARTARDRWALDETDRGEEYAEDTARLWTRTVASAYFSQAHPLEARAFEDWIMSHVGVPISLVRVAEDLDRSIWGVHKGLLEVCARWGEIDELDARVEIANQFHYVEDFQLARDVLATVLAIDPEHVPATTLMGDIAVHERNWSDALRWTQKAILLAPQEFDAHEDRIEALIGAQDWTAAVAACGVPLELAPDQTSYKHCCIRLERARCLMELGDFAAAGEDLDAVIAHGRRGHKNDARALRAEWLVRQGRWAEALSCAEEQLGEKPPLWEKTLLTAAAWEASRNLRADHPSPIPTARHIALLQWHGRHAWVDRLLGLGLKPATDRPTRRQADKARRRDGQRIRL